MSMNDPIELLKNLVAIDSVNPDLVPGGGVEAEVATFCADWLAARGFEVHRVEEVAGRPSIVGIARGSGGGRSLMFNGHIDTVSTASYEGDALAPEIRDGKLFGRGSFDMKSGVAAMMVAAARRKRRACAATSSSPASPTRNTPPSAQSRWHAVSRRMRPS